MLVSVRELITAHHWLQQSIFAGGVGILSRDFDGHTPSSRPLHRDFASAWMAWALFGFHGFSQFQRVGCPITKDSMLCCKTAFELVGFGSRSGWAQLMQSYSHMQRRRSLCSLKGNSQYCFDAHNEDGDLAVACLQKAGTSVRGC